MQLAHAIRNVRGLAPAILALCILSAGLTGGCFSRFGGDGVSEPPASEGAPPNGDDETGEDESQPDDEDDDSTDEMPCLPCHGSPMGDRRAVVDESGAGGHVLSGEQLTDADCQVCHEMTQHQQGSVRLRVVEGDSESVVVLSGDPLREPSEADKLLPFCGACHDDGEQTVHAIGGDSQPACTACHNLHDPSSANLSLVSSLVYNQTLGEEKPVLFTARTDAGSFNDGDPDANDGICQVCHTATTYHQHDGTAAAHYDGAVCTSCHSHAAGFIPSAGEASCIACHSSSQGDRPAVVNSDGTGGHHLEDSALTDGDCVTCHEMTEHQQGTVRLWANPDAPDSVIAVSDDPSELAVFCTNCHSGTGHPTTHSTATPWQPTCMQCHEMHDPANGNLSLVADVVRNETLDEDKPVVFTARTGSGSYSDGELSANDGICQVCHTATDYHRHDGTGVAHYDGTNCVNCHLHATGFLPAGGATSCSGCHSVAQAARRPVVSEFSLASHHVQGAGATDADCVVCHELSEHKQGQVRLRNVDDPSNAAATVRLVADPLSNSAEAAKLEPFCLACHDGDGAAGGVPFSDGLMPSPIDDALWASASHGVGPTTCIGDGQTFGCHGTGHGSVKVSLLAPWDGSQAGIEGDAMREEEGLCYSCHDADGPASTDIQARFALATHHNVSSVDQADGSRVECADCHDPHVASTTAPLTDPDTGGSWAGTCDAFCLTCHDGSPPAAVLFPGASPGTGYDKSAFLGTTHDTQLGGRSCSHCHEAHGSSHMAMLEERYVVTDYNPYSTDAYAVCWICHEEAKTIDQLNAFRNRHREHVRNEDSPCIICHDVHAGYDPGEPGLINFAYPAKSDDYDATFIEGQDGSTSFRIDTDRDRGSCYISCHGRDHTPKHYARQDVSTTDCTACHVTPP